MSPLPSELAHNSDQLGSGMYLTKSAYNGTSLPFQKPMLTLPPPSSSTSSTVGYYPLPSLSHYSLGLSLVFLHTLVKQQQNGLSYLDPFSYPVSSALQLLSAGNLDQNLSKRSDQPQNLLNNSIQGMSMSMSSANIQTNTQPSLSQFAFHNKTVLGLHPSQRYLFPGQHMFLNIQGLNHSLKQKNILDHSQNHNNHNSNETQNHSQNREQTITHQMIAPASVITDQNTYLKAIQNNRYAAGYPDHRMRQTENALSQSRQPITSDDLFVYFKDLAIFKGKSRTKYSGKMFIHSKHTKSLKDFHELKNVLSSFSTTEAKPYTCTFDGCTWSFARQSDLRRHAKSHKEPMFHCPYWRLDPTCHRNGGSFSRLDMLKRHLRLVHYVKDKELLFPGSDPGWCRACQKMFLSSKQFMDHCMDCANDTSPAEWRSVSKTDKDEQDLENTT